MSSFGSDTPYMLLAKLKVKEDKLAEYIEMLIRQINLLKLKNLECSVILLIKILFVLYGQKFIKIDDALLTHLAIPVVGVYLQAHAELGTDFSVEFYGTLGNKVIVAMNGT